MRLTQKQLEDVFLALGGDTISLSTFWSIVHYARSNDGVELRAALHRVRKQSREAAIFAERILQPADLDDFVYVIDALSAEITGDDISTRESLRRLQAWHAGAMIQDVIQKRNAVHSASGKNEKGFACA